MKYKIKDLPKSERPRERLRKRGPDSLSKAELLALIIRSGTEGKNVVEVAKEILTEFNFKNLTNSSLNELQQFEGIGEVKAGQILAVFELFNRFSPKEKEEVKKIITSQEAIDYFKPILKNSEEEKLAMTCLDSNNRVLTENIRDNIITRGTIDRINIETRPIVKKALKENATAVILAHNHPGGDPTPSEEDVKLTENIFRTLQEVDVKLLDHIIIGKNKTESLRELEKLSLG